jgi:hypothetical protein
MKSLSLSHSNSEHLLNSNEQPKRMKSSSGIYNIPNQLYVNLDSNNNHNNSESMY